ncbi:MAG: hypothetical protein AB4372_14565 [Xenococcus sp. (in: cyanobacteria)]
MKLIPSTVILLTLIIFIKSVKAEPNSCDNLAMMAAEIQAVDTLQKMYELQLEIIKEKDKLQELNKQKSQGYDPYDQKSIDEYNVKVEEYNNVVKKKNKLSDEYNELQDSYNLVTDEIGLTLNTPLVNCLNSESFSLEMNTSQINVDNLLVNTENLTIETENVRRRLKH